MERQDMIRRTISLPEAVDALIRGAAHPGESYSATVARLIEEGANVGATKRRPTFVGIADVDAPVDLGRDAELYLRDLLTGDRAVG